MRNVKTRRNFDRVAEKNEIEVESTRGTWVRALASVVMLDCEETIEDVAG